MKKPSSSATDSPCEVGYGKPPKANQFRKGRTGNPRGKRQGEENIISAFKRIVSKRVKINDGDKVRTDYLSRGCHSEELQRRLAKESLCDEQHLSACGRCRRIR